MMPKTRYAVAYILCCALFACDAAPPGTTAAAPTGTIDSIFPMDVMIDRFQQTMPSAPDSLVAPYATSLDGLMGRLGDALQARDTAALDELRLTAPEFAHLYFPTSMNARKPYEQPPATAWQLLELNSVKGRGILVRKLGGRSIDGH